MDQPRISLWRTFQDMAKDYPDCNAVRLTLEMQRWFIAIQQEQFCDRAKMVVNRAAELQAIS